MATEDGRSRVALPAELDFRLQPPRMSLARLPRSPSHLRIVSEAAPRPEPAARTAEGAHDERARDRERLLAVSRGDRQAAAALYDEHVGRVHAALVRVLGSRNDEHPDLVQRVFVELVRSASSFRGECGLGTWISRIAANVALNELRGQRRKRAVFASEELPDVAAPRAPDPETARALRTALGLIAPEKAEAVLLHDLLGHDLTEIAEMCGATVAATQSRLVRGRKELRALLEEALRDDP